MKWIEHRGHKHRGALMLATFAVLGVGMWLAQVRESDARHRPPPAPNPSSHSATLADGVPPSIDLVLVKDIPSDAVDDDPVFLVPAQGPHCTYLGHIHRQTLFTPGDLVPDTRWALVIADKEDCETHVFAPLPVPYQGMVVSKQASTKDAVFLQAGTLIDAAAIDIHDPAYKTEAGKTCIGDWRPYAVSANGQHLGCVSGEWKMVVSRPQPAH